MPHLGDLEEGTNAVTRHRPVSDPGQVAFPLCALPNLHFSRRRIYAWLTSREGFSCESAGALRRPGSQLWCCFGKDIVFLGENGLAPVTADRGRDRSCPTLPFPWGQLLSLTNPPVGVPMHVF